MASSLERKSHPKINHAEPEDEITKEEEDESFCYAIQLVGSSVLSMSLQSAIELGVFDIIGKEGPGAKLSSSEIAAKIGTKNPEAPMMIDRILRLLTSHSVLNCSLVSANEDENGGGSDFQRVYSLGPVSKYFVNDEEGGSLGPVLTFTQDKVYMESWSQLKDAIVEGGIPFNRVHGTHAFEYPDLDPRFNQAFNTAMFNHTTIVIKKLLHIYKGFEDKNLTQLVDVGGGLGVNLNLITSRYHHIKGINFDLPHVVNHAPSYPGVQHVGGDMFASVPSGDAIFMKWILHDWSDKHCLKLLKNCYKAIPDNGKVIVVEAILPAMPDTSTAVKSTSQLDVMMMTQYPGGKERSEQEFMALATGGGFSGIRYECFVCNFWVMEFFK
ncbi:PREDICTED: caffeic acid 3-O-methyltransferase-like [Prunus mume]|uniref:Caffeic acid 3-O-methyltransferase-like n=1 Tax=Prunus mume TaxID=102107 RepID=A0ABM0PTF8_PRUMU|nr:PREDICTED: caffeic acid 3-O-methyltransferase-like [Prunus mume]